MRREVAQDRSQGAQPSDPQDDVVALHGDGEHVEAERFPADLKKDVAGQALARHAFAVGHYDVSAPAVQEA